MEGYFSLREPFFCHRFSQTYLLEMGMSRLAVRYLRTIKWKVGKRLRSNCLMGRLPSFGVLHKISWIFLYSSELGTFQQREDIKGGLASASGIFAPDTKHR